MPAIASSITLRNLLLADAATCIAMGLLLAVGADALSRLTLIPAALLLYAGLALLPIAAFMAAVALRAAIPPAGALLVVAGNALWAACSILLLLSGWIEPNVLGGGFIAVQAAAVALLAVLEYGALNGASALRQPR